MSRLLLLKVKMRRIDFPVSKIGRHFQTFSVADEGVGVFVCGSILSMNVLVYECPLFKKKRIQCSISPDRSIEELISPSQ